MVASLAPLFDANYHLREVTNVQPDYYVHPGSAAGRWAGAGAVHLGLAGVVEAGQLRGLFAGRDPVTGAFLVSAQGSAVRASARRGPAGGLPPEGFVSLKVAAGAAGVSRQYLARIVTTQRPKDGGVHLLGARDESGHWRVHVDEVSRFSETRKPPRAVPAFDFALRAPKSVSLLFALGHLVSDTDLARAGVQVSSGGLAQAVVECHQAAVGQALDLLGRHACWVRGPQGRVLGRGLTVAAFDHVASRSGDPLLHTHMVIGNVAEGVDGVRRTLDATALFAWARTAGHVYQAALRHQLSLRLGVMWQAPHEGVADIVGVERKVIEAFSVRRREILAELARTGRRGAAAAQAATLKTRKAKGEVGERGHPRPVLEAKAAAVGFGAAEILATVGPSRRPDPSQEVLNGVADRLASAEGLTARASTVDLRDALSQWANGLVDGALLADLETLAVNLLTDPARFTPLVDQPATVRRTDGHHVRAGGVGTAYTTPALASAERTLLEIHRRTLDAPPTSSGASQTGTLLHLDELDPNAPALLSPPRPSGAVLSAHILGRFPTLRPDQRIVAGALAAVRPSGFEILVGPPGSGKTFALAAATAAWRGRGLRVLGCALQGGAAQVLATEAGMDDTCTLTGILSRIGRCGAVKTLARTVVVVDEAGMADTLQLCRLALACQSADAALVLVGDPDQIPEVGPGGAFAALVRQAGPHGLRLDGNHRQVDMADQTRAELLRDGQADDALRSAQDDGRLTVDPDPDSLRLRLIDDWAADPGIPGRDKLILATTVAEVEHLAALARSSLNTSHRLTGATLTVRLTAPDRPVNERDLRVGDRVRAQRNDHRLRVHTGMVGTITRLHAARSMVTVEWDVHPSADGVTPPVHRTKLNARFLNERTTHTAHRARIDAPGLTWAYAATANAAQGRTSISAYVLASEAGGHRQAAYVMATRARESTRWYAMTTGDPTELETHQWPGHLPEPDPEDTTRLAERLAVDGAKHLAHDLDPHAHDLAALIAVHPPDLWAERTLLAERLDAPVHPSLGTRQLIDRLSVDLNLPSSRLDVPSFHRAARQALARANLGAEAIAELLARRSESRKWPMTGARNPVGVLIAALNDIPQPVPATSADKEAWDRLALVDEALDRQRTLRLDRAPYDQDHPLVGVCGPAPLDNPAALAHWRIAAAIVIDQRAANGVHHDGCLLAADPLGSLLAADPAGTVTAQFHQARTRCIAAQLATHAPKHPIGAPPPGKRSLGAIETEIHSTRTHLERISNDRRTSPAASVTEPYEGVRLHAPGRTRRLSEQLEGLFVEHAVRDSAVRREALLHPPLWARNILYGVPIDGPAPDPEDGAHIIADLAADLDATGQPIPELAQMHQAVKDLIGHAPEPLTPAIGL